MATRTTDDQLAEIRRHIDTLEARAAGAADTPTGLHDRLERLRKQEASAWAAVHERAEAIDETFRQLEIEIAVAENRLASELSDDATSFADAVEAELHEWDAAIERLQTRAAARALEDRAEAEAEIAELRHVRNRAFERLSLLSASADGAWQEQKNGITDALDELERKVRKAGRQLNGGERHGD